MPTSQDARLAAGMTLSQIALAYGTTPVTIRRLIVREGIQPLGKKDGKVVYALAPFVPALAKRVSGLDTNGEATGNGHDPYKLSPAQRRSHFAAELVKQKMLISKGMLIPIDSFRKTMAAGAKVVIQFLETLPDILERDYGMSVAQVQRIEERIDRLREEIYDTMRSEFTALARVKSDPIGGRPVPDESLPVSDEEEDKEIKRQQARQRRVARNQRKREALAAVAGGKGVRRATGNQRGRSKNT